MAPNTRDTPLRRFSTYVWGGALMLGIGIFAVLLAPALMGPPTELEDDYLRAEEIEAKLQAIHNEQAEIKASYKFDREKAAQDLFKKLQKQVNGEEAAQDNKEQ